MVRIINQQQASKAAPAQLTEKSKVLLQVIGIVIADKPQAIRELLEDYSIEFDTEPTEKELTDQLMTAIGECDTEFNSDLASIVLDCTLENNYDDFDFKSIFKKKDGDQAADDGKFSGGGNGGGGGLWAGIANAVGGIGGAIGQGIKGKQAKEQATATTLQGIYAYKSQLAANDQSKGKNKVKILIALFVLLGLAITALIYYNKKQNQQPTLLNA